MNLCAASLRRPAVSGGASGAIAVGVLRAFHAFVERAEPVVKTGEESFGLLAEPCVCRRSELHELLELPGAQALLGAFACGLALLPLLDLLGVLRRCWARALLALERRISLWLAGAGLLYRPTPSSARIA